MKSRCMNSFVQFLSDNLLEAAIIKTINVERRKNY